MRSTVLVWVAAGVAWSAVAFGDPLDKPAFTATPAELLAAAKQAPASTANEDATVLRIDEELRFDEHARMTDRWHMVVVIRTKAGVDRWDSLGYQYRPSYQNVPQSRARVIAPDGTVAEPDPKRLREDPLATTADSTNGTVPLPRLVVGSVVEQEVVTSDREAMSSAGSSNTVPISGSLSTRVTVVAPASLKVHTFLHGFAALRPTHSTSGGTETWQYAFGTTTMPVVERNVPPDYNDWPRLTATSIPSWAALAKALGARVDAQIAAGPITLAADLPHSPTVASARAILTWLQAHVESDRVTVSEASIVPKSPAETLKAGRADKLAMAVAYTALLRQAGITAAVALIDPGPGTDLATDIPELGDLDHALVRARLDGHDVWIDPTSDALGLLTMPSTDRHRRALVLDAATTALVDTPSIAATDNVLRDVRTYELAESGRARITEVRRFGGLWELGTRTQKRDDPNQFEKDLGEDAKFRYAIDAVDRMTTTNPTALDIPFEVTSVMTSRRGFTARKQADVILYPNDLTWALPDAFVKADQPARKLDYQWSTPHIYEIESRIVVPDGYAMPAIADRTRDLGTIKLTETQRIAGNVLTVMMRLDTGKIRITAAELEATRKALHGLVDENVHLAFPNTAHQAFEKGAWKNAISEANRVIAAHPKDGKHHAALAELLVQMGLGEAGRREARLAVQLDPNDADNHVMLGWALAHDLFGRAYAPGHDHAGARAELEKARKLDPKHVGAAVELGNLLARDERGRIWDRGADPKASVIARRAANEIEPSTAHALDLARALLAAGDYSEAERVMRAETSSDDRDVLLICAVAVRSGTAAAIRAADDIGSTDARKHAITGAGGALMLLRHYDEARALYAEANVFGPNTQQGQSFARLAVVDHPLDIKTPAGAVIEAELTVMRDDKPSGFWDAKTADETSVQVKSVLRAANKASWLSREFYGDIARTMATNKVEGDKRAWRIEYASGAKVEVAYAADDRGTIKVIGDSSVPRGLGRHALRLLAKDDVEAATRVLDWAAKDAKRSPLMDMVWGPNHGTDRDAVALAAAVLTGPSDPDHALPILKKCAAAPPKGDLACLLVVSEINDVRGTEDDTIAHLTTYLSTHPKDPGASRILADTLARAGRGREAEALLPDLVAPFDRDIDEIRFHVALADNDVPRAVKILEAETKAASGARHSFNELAWLEVTTNTNLQGALPAATEAVRLDSNDSTLQTKAVVEAEVGDLRAAMDDDRKAIELRPRNEPDGNDWYVLGRVAELIGQREDAIEAYRKVKPTHPPRQVADSATLAQRRLTALGRP